MKNINKRTGYLILILFWLMVSMVVLSSYTTQELSYYDYEDLCENCDEID